jgi:hypothetical protein
MSNGKIIIRLRSNNSNGKFEAKVIGHEGVRCADGLDEKLLHDLMESEVEGFDAITPEDSGHTPEYYKDKNKGMKPKDQEAPFPEEEEKEKGKKEDLSLGFGV